MRVHLLAVTSLGMEPRRQRLAISELIPCDHSNTSPLGEHIEQRGLKSPSGMSKQETSHADAGTNLACARFPRWGGQLSSNDPTSHVTQQASHLYPH